MDFLIVESILYFSYPICHDPIIIGTGDETHISLFPNSHRTQNRVSFLVFHFWFFPYSLRRPFTEGIRQASQILSRFSTPPLDPRPHDYDGFGASTIVYIILNFNFFNFEINKHKHKNNKDRNQIENCTKQINNILQSCKLS